MAMGGMGLRTVWVAIRGMNYSDRAFREVGGNITTLEERQKQMQRTMAITSIAAGAMFIALAAMASYSIGRLMDMTQKGHQIMFAFGKATENMLKSLGNAFVTVLGPSIQMLTSFLNAISRSQPLMAFFAVVATGLITLLSLYGVMLLLRGVSTLLSFSFGGLGKAMAEYAIVSQFPLLATEKLAFTFNVLKASLGSAMLIFMLMNSVAMMLGKNAWVLIPILGALTIAMVAYAVATHKAALGMAMLTWGASAILGVAAFLAAQASIPTYQAGTRVIQRTGPAIVHAGEEIRRANQPATTQEATPRHVTWNVTIPIEHVHTEAKFDDVYEKIRRALKDLLGNKV